jgi:hypothetical protein
VQLRERKQGRAVPIDAFINACQVSIQNVQKAKDVFGGNITIYFAKNDYTKNVESVAVDVDDIAKLLPEKYSKEELKQLLCEKND